MAGRGSGREGRAPLPAGPMTSVLGLAIGLGALAVILTILDQ